VVTPEDTPCELPLSSFDVDGDNTSAVIVTMTSHGQFDSGDRLYTPGADFHGDDRLQYYLTDGDLDSEICTIDIVISSVNDLPPGPVIAIEPEMPTTADDLLCVVVEPSLDVEGDDVTYEVRWTRDGEVYDQGLVTLIEGDTVPASATLSGEQWICRMEARDPYGAGGANTVTVDLP
jgi:hypothetical protein